MLTFDVKQNNWLLPTVDDYYFDQLRQAMNIPKPHEHIVREQGQQVLIDMEIPLTFNEMQVNWWPQYFSAMTTHNLRAYAIQQGINIKGVRTKAVLVAVVSEYYEMRFK